MLLPTSLHSVDRQVLFLHGHSRYNLVKFTDIMPFTPAGCVAPRRRLSAPSTFLATSAIQSNCHSLPGRRSFSAVGPVISLWYRRRYASLPVRRSTSARLDLCYQHGSHRDDTYHFLVVCQWHSSSEVLCTLGRASLTLFSSCLYRYWIYRTVQD